MQYLSSFPEQLQIHKDKLENFQIWQSKRVVEKFEKGSKYDVRDTENSIWCVAEVIEIIKTQNHSDILLIRYIDWDHTYNEYICSKSS